MIYRFKSGDRVSWLRTVRRDVEVVYGSVVADFEDPSPSALVHVAPDDGGVRRYIAAVHLTKYDSR